MIYKFIATKTVRFSGPTSNGPLTLEVTYDNGDTWIPYNQIYGGSMSGVDEKNGWGISNWPNSQDNEWLDWQLEKIHHCSHKWVDTGMIKTFCKECDADGEYNPMTGQVTVIFRNKKEENKK
jgi:hypothetical protein